MSASKLISLYNLKNITVTKPKSIIMTITEYYNNTKKLVKYDAGWLYSRHMVPGLLLNGQRHEVKICSAVVQTSVMSVKVRSAQYGQGHK